MDPIKKLYQGMTKKAIAKARHHTKPPTRFRPSEAADCMRKIWFRLKGQRPEPRTAKSDMYGIKGDVDHDTTRQLLNHYGAPVGGVEYDEHGNSDEKMSVMMDFEVELPADRGKVSITVSGRADGEIAPDTDLPDDLALCEIKGTGFYPYEWLDKAYTGGFRRKDATRFPPGHDAAVERVKEKHKSWYWQCQTTMAITGHTRCYLIVVDRSSGTIGLHNQDTDKREGILFDFDPEVWKEILERFAYIKFKLNADEMPPAEYTLKSAECSWCPFFYACHGASERRQRGLTPAVVYPGPQMEQYNEDDSGAERPDAQREDDSGNAST